MTTLITNIDPSRLWTPLQRILVMGVCFMTVAGCGPGPGPSTSSPDARPAGSSWAVTAWGNQYEIFAEIDPLVAGELARAHTHVTALDGFTPVEAGQVEIVITDSGGEQVFRSSAPVRPGIFTIEIRGQATQEADLAFRVQTSAGSEVIRGGTVRIGSVSEPGGPLRLPAPRGASDGGEPQSFLKEEQWRSEFATTWVRRGQLAASVSGPVRLQAPAGGDASVTAPVDGVLRPPGGSPDSWPFVGMQARKGAALFRLTPHVSSGRSLASLEAEVAIAATELEVARNHLERLNRLWELEAISRRELDEATARVETTTAHHAAALKDLEAARSARQGGGSDSLTLRAPFTGEVADVTASPGTTVAAGTVLARLVRTDSVWLDVALAPAAAQRLRQGAVRGVVLSGPEYESIRLNDVELVSIAPELSQRTGTVAVLLQAPRVTELPLGTMADGQILLQQVNEGIVVPASALVDDGGVPVVYLQLAGETFVRQPVEVLERQGTQLLVEGLVSGQRLVSRGGVAIRRASLMAGGEAHGHVH